MQAIPRGEIDVTMQQALEMLLEPDELDQRKFAVAVIVHEQVDISLVPQFATRARPIEKQRRRAKGFDGLGISLQEPIVSLVCITFSLFA